MNILKVASPVPFIVAAERRIMRAFKREMAKRQGYGHARESSRPRLDYASAFSGLNLPLDGFCGCRTLPRAAMLATALLLCACSSRYQGVECQGKIRHLSGQPIGDTNALIIDRFNSFSVTTADGKVESGMLFSADRTQYIPSSVTREGLLAQRLSDKQFSIINASADQWITYTCP